ncbi:hypothetical protein K402DRAFT_384395 [Aulographum hederae CBS 113979]|uniref:MARVEL domain-containing protein n=1 Tax=Aulographum hederae CBS 113979 TaxID=1176131 RepID=A0A6G1GP68_9PEZI|nr:hypothetical protein K402DRAFT_384395 [Aulographum hederae CBS 113979]
MISGFFFIIWRLAEIITLIPTVGMLAWFVNGFQNANTLTPDSILVLFIVSTLGLAWAFFTLLFYAKSKHSGLFVALVDLCFVGAFIAGVYFLRGVTETSCSNFQSGDFYLSLGEFGYIGVQNGSRWALNINKNCAMLKAAFAFGIMNCIFFFITFFWALFVARNHRKDDKVVVRREVRSRHGSRHGSREYASSPRRSHHSHRSSRQRYYV